jgi:hypothetical protein
MGALLIILQIIGAIPQIIEAAKKIWELIKQIRNKEEKAIAKRKLRKLILRREHVKKMSADDQAVLMSELQGLHEEVASIIKKENLA